jgi:polyisoprenoid-binding protein YceI
MTFFKKCFLFLILLSFPLLSSAAAWKIVADSSLTFTAIQNGAPVTGSFKKFTGTIDFDPASLATSHIKIIVDMASVSDSYNQLSDTLKTSDWFNSKVFPQAVFESTSIAKTGDKDYEAKGTLTIRGKSLPVVLTFNQEEYTATKAVMSGSTTLKRTAFGIGEGQWSDTKAVQDNVIVKFKIVAVH